MKLPLQRYKLATAGWSVVAIALVYTIRSSLNPPSLPAASNIDAVHSHSGQDKAGSDVFPLRRKLLEKTCKKYSHFFTPQYFSLYGSDSQMSNVTSRYFKWKEKQYLMLNLLKGGSTTWLQYFYLHNISVTYYCPECLVKMDKIIIQVRHPLERLISTYRMIFEEQGWRNLLTEGFDVLGPGVEDYFVGMSWVKFVTIVVPKTRFTRNVQTMYGGLDDRVFESMLMLHWAPYWFSLKYCLEEHRPHYILHMETLDDDFKRLRGLLGLPDFKYRVIVKGEYGMSNRSDFHSSELIEKYYSQLTKQQVQDIFIMYSLDHEMFGYSPDLFLHYAQE